jgi:hypothetical protein
MFVYTHHDLKRMSDIKGNRIWCSQSYKRPDDSFNLNDHNDKKLKVSLDPF